MNLHSNLTEDDRKYILSTSECIPGLLTIPYSSKTQYKQAVESEITHEWSTFIQLLEKGELQYDDILKLLVCYLHDLPITVFDLDKDEQDELLPVKSFLVEIDQDMKPKLNIKLSQKSTENIIKLLRKSKMTLLSDEKSVLGYIFEGAVGTLLCDLDIDVKSLDTDTAVCSHKIQIRSISECRYSNSSEVSTSLLWKTELGGISTDYFSLVNVPNIGTYLLLIQTSTISRDHKQKIETVVKVPELLLNASASENEQPPRNVIYVYVNPFYNENLLEVASIMYNTVFSSSIN